MKHLNRILSVIWLATFAATLVAPAGSALALYSAPSVTWSPSQAIDLSSTAAQLNPAVAIDNTGNIYTVWEDYRSGNADIYFSQLAAGTATWSTPVRLNDDGSAANQVKPDIAVGGSYIYVVWEDYRNEDADIYSTRRLVSGGGWETNLRVDHDRGNGDMPDVGDQKRPRLCVNTGGNAYAVWQDKRNDYKKTYYGQRAVGDSDWSLSDKVTSGEGTYPTDPNEQANPDIACFGSGASLLRYAVWEDYRSDNANVFYSRGNPDFTWSPAIGEKIVDDTNHRQQTMPSMVFDAAATALAVWIDDRTGSAQIWGSSHPNGGWWSANYQISNAGARNIADAHPRLAMVLNTGVPYIVWVDAAGNVAYTYWSGAGWAAQAAVSNSNTGTHTSPDIAASANGSLYVVWSDGRGGGNAHVYFTTNGPATNDSSLAAWPGAAWNGSQFYLDMTVHNSETSNRSVVATVQLPSDFYFVQPALGSAMSTQSSIIQVSAHALTWTQQLAGGAHSSLPSWTVYVSTTLTLPTVLNSTMVITDHVLGSTNAKALSAPMIVNPRQTFLPLAYKR